MPEEPQLQHHHLSPFERHVVRELAEIKGDVKTILAKPDVTLEVKCSPTVPVPPVNPPPAAPRAPILGKGESRNMISYPVTMPAFVEPDTAKSTLYWSENGGAEQTQDFTTSGASGSLVVNEGANVDYSCDVSDRAGNRSERSVHGTITNANDTTPPAAPAAPNLGAGQTTDAPAPPLLAKGKKVK